MIPRLSAAELSLNAEPLSDTSEAQEEHRKLKDRGFSVGSCCDVKLSAHGTPLLGLSADAEVGVVRQRSYYSLRHDKSRKNNPSINYILGLKWYIRSLTQLSGNNCVNKDPCKSRWLAIPPPPR